MTLQERRTPPPPPSTDPHPTPPHQRGRSSLSAFWGFQIIHAQGGGEGGGAFWKDGAAEKPPGRSPAGWLQQTRSSAVTGKREHTAGRGEPTEAGLLEINTSG